MVSSQVQCHQFYSFKNLLKITTWQAKENSPLWQQTPAQKSRGFFLNENGIVNVSKELIVNLQFWNFKCE